MPPRIRTYHELEENRSDLGDQVAAQDARVADRLASVGAVIAVMSGKGGVGKSLISCLLATAWAREGRAVGLVDADLNGPSAARLLGLDPRPLGEAQDGVEPARTRDGIRLMSMSLLLEEGRALAWHEPDAASFVWRGAQERGALREFLGDVVWGDLEVLLVDLPPVTQRLTDLHELAPGLAGVVAVTIPSAASADAVGRSLDLARSRAIPILGLVENLAGYRCPDCGAVGPLHPGTAGEDLSARSGTPLLGRIPFEPTLGEAAEAGRLGAWLDGAGAPAGAFVALAGRIAGRAFGENDA